MKQIIRVLLMMAIVALVSGCNTSTVRNGSSWSCNAEGLVNSNYDGSSRAYIHLQGYGSGGSYQVTLNESETEATGTTKDGTPFTCKINE